jgi:hypothetical protein
MLSLRELCINKIVSQKINSKNELPLTLFNSEIIKFISEQKHEYVMYLIKFIPMRIINETNFVNVMFNKYIILFKNNYTDRHKRFELLNEILNRKPDNHIVKLFLTKCTPTDINDIIKCIPKELFNTEIIKLIIHIYKNRQYAQCRYGFLKYIEKKLFNEEIVKLIISIGRFRQFKCGCVYCCRGILQFMPIELLNDEIINMIFDTYEKQIVETARIIPKNFFTDKLVKKIIFKCPDFDCLEKIYLLISYIPDKFRTYDNIYMSITKCNIEHINNLIPHIPSKIFNREIIILLLNKMKTFDAQIFKKYVPIKLLDDEIIKMMFSKTEVEYICRLASLIPVELYTDELVVLLIDKCYLQDIMLLIKTIPIQFLNNKNVISIINRCKPIFFKEIPKVLLNEETVKIIIHRHVLCNENKINENKMHTYDNYNELLEIIPIELQTDEIMNLIDITRDTYNKSLDAIKDAMWF